VVRRLLLVVGKDEKEEIVSIADQFIEEGRSEGRKEGRSEGRKEGRSEGRKEGRSEGRKEGRQELLLKLLRARFGALPQEAVERIESADVAQLDAWSDRLLTAPTLDGVLHGA
jgi:flagellar biosynthesis/type III secretory pathway protein FliH